MNPPNQEIIFKTMRKSGFSVRTIISNSGLDLDYVYNRMRGIVATPLTEEDRQKLWDAIPDKKL